MANLVIRGFSNSTISSLVVRGYYLAPAPVTPILPENSKNNKYFFVSYEDRSVTVIGEDRDFLVSYESRVLKQ